jgi:alpha,alpha-trehalase
MIFSGGTDIGLSKSPSALTRFPEISKRLKAKRLAAFFDFDGTLTPIVSRPDRAILSDETRARLVRLSRLTPVTAIVSGRARDDLERRVGISSLIYAGCHGFDIGGPQGRIIERQEGRGFDAVVAKAAAALRTALDGMPGLIIEDKTYCLGLHYRHVPPHLVGTLREAVDAAAASFPQLRKIYGKKVVELRPDVPWDKGRAVLWILEALGLNGGGVLPIYFGDDVTDADAFRALSGIGIGIYVSRVPEPTIADYRLRNTAEVGLVLDRLIAALETTS